MPHTPITAVDLSDLPSKSARIRRLKDLGYRQVDIAKHLDVREQHVSNVVRGPRPKGETPSRAAGVAETPRSFTSDSSTTPARLVVQEGGMLRLPSGWNVRPGAVFIARNFLGDIVLMQAENALSAAQAPNGSMADELIAERRLEAMREFDD